MRRFNSILIFLVSCGGGVDTLIKTVADHLPELHARERAEAFSAVDRAPTEQAARAASDAVLKRWAPLWEATDKLSTAPCDVALALKVVAPEIEVPKGLCDDTP